MKAAVFGTFGASDVCLEAYLPKETDEILYRSTDEPHSSVRRYAVKYGIRLTEVFPNYRIYSRGALIMMDEAILSDADFFLIFWDGAEPKLGKLLAQIIKTGKPYVVISKTEPVY